MRRHILPSLRVFLALAGILAVACRPGHSVDTVRVEQPVVVEPTATPIVHENPLTGEQFEGEQSWVGRRPLVIKIGNSPPERPQSGLEAADIVYEEMVEGGLTRFAAVFHSREPGTVGPVRSARMVDPVLLAPLSPLFGYSGATPEVISTVRAAPSVTDVGVDRLTHAYRRVGDRKAPYNLYADASALWSSSGGPPQPMFTWLPQGQTVEPSAGQDGDSVTMSFSHQLTVRYDYDPATSSYRRFLGTMPHTLADGSQVSPTNVIVQFVGVQATGGRDANGESPVHIDVVGSGDTIVLTGGRAFRGRWERAGDDPTRFIDANGHAIQIARGPTFVALVPIGRQVSLG